MRFSRIVLFCRNERKALGHGKTNNRSDANFPASASGDRLIFRKEAGLSRLRRRTQANPGVRRTVENEG